MHADEKDLVHIYRRSDTGSFYLHYTLDGKRHRKKVGRSRKEAELLKNEMELKLFRSEHIFSPKNVSLKGFSKDYLKYVEATKAAKTLSGGYYYKVTTFVEHCHKLKPTQIKPNDVNNFILSRLKEVEPATVASDLRVLKAWFNWGKANGYIAANPCDKVQKIRNIKKNQPRFLEQDEVDQLLEKSKNHPFRPLIATAVYAGLRRKELIYLEWKDVDFKNNRITVENKEDFHTKSYKARTIPFNKKLKNILLPYKKTNGYCFTNGQNTQWLNNISRDFAAFCKRAGLENCTLHVLRHTFASQLVMAGVSIYKVSQWLGHSDVKTTMIYAHLSPQDDDINRI